jgi:hypothetical protein
MSRADREERTGLAAEVRRQASASLTSRYLRSLPMFQVEPDLPAAVRELLGEIDRAERAEKRPG